MVHWGLTRAGGAQNSWDKHLQSHHLSSDHHIPGADQALAYIHFILAQPAGDRHCGAYQTVP